MGCSPSHAVIINSSPSQETICLQPRIYMVSESTLCLLKDVGELRVYHVDETDPERAVEKYRGAPEQLQNPLLFHPQLRRRERMNTEDLQSLPGPSNSVGKVIEIEDIKQNDGDRMEITENEEQGDDVDDQNRYSASGIIGENVAKQEDNTQSSNAHSVTVEVYRYRAVKSRNDDGTTAENLREMENDCKPLDDVENENTAAAVDFVAASEQNQQTPDEQSGSEHEDLDNVLPDAILSWTETVDRAMPGAKKDSEIAKAPRKKATNEEIVELDSFD